MQKAEDLKKELDELSRKILSLNPADKPYREAVRRISKISPAVEKYDRLLEAGKQMREAEELVLAEDRELAELAGSEAEDLSGKIRALESELEALLGELAEKPGSDVKGVIVEIRAGAGGDEAALFAGDLFNMYGRFAEGKGWSLEVMDASESEFGGFKEIIFGLEGENAWRMMRFEGGVHRVQRIPETESSGRLHTSTVTVAVLPEVSTGDEIEMDPGDLRIDTYRSSGAGGQHVNVTDSAVRITHIPSGVAVQCQDERSQHKNKAKAMRVLKARLVEAERERREKETAMDRSRQVKTGDRSQKIRTYNYPQNRLTDHRINLSLHKLDSILRGDLDRLVHALIEGEPGGLENG